MCTNGAVTNVVDNNDLPADNNPCTDDTCSNGMPQNMNVRRRHGVRDQPDV